VCDGGSVGYFDVVDGEPIVSEGVEMGGIEPHGEGGGEAFGIGGVGERDQVGDVVDLGDRVEVEVVDDVIQVGVDEEGDHVAAECGAVFGGGGKFEGFYRIH